jgi:hypothetical protein
MGISASRDAPGAAPGGRVSPQAQNAAGFDPDRAQPDGLGHVLADDP